MSTAVMGSIKKNGCNVMSYKSDFSRAPQDLLIISIPVTHNPEKIGPEKLWLHLLYLEPASCSLAATFSPQDYSLALHRTRISTAVGNIINDDDFDIRKLTTLS